MVLNIAVLLFLGRSTILGSIEALLMMLGFYKVFGKCKVDGRKVLIPAYREYLLGKITDCEQEGIWLMIFRVISVLAGIGALFLTEANYVTGFYLLAQLFAYSITTLLTMKIYIGMIELFGLRKRWFAVWLFFPYIAALIMGFSPKYQPKWTVEDFQNKVNTFFSGTTTDILENGLTVNLEDRSVISKFKKKYLLRDIHMAIKPGHMVLLLGGSGAGKSTLLHAINGYEKANAEITLNGDNLYSNYKKMQFEIGFVPQQDLMRGSDTVQSTLDDAATLRLPATFTKAEKAKRAEEVMKIFGLLPVRNSMVEKLSGGQKKRLSIAMEFISNPTLFILDEPDSGLDGVMAQELMTQLRHIADQGKIVIVITHTPDRVIDLFDDVIVLAKDQNRTGRLAFFGSIAYAREFFQRERMEEIVKCINRQEEGGEGRADEFINRFVEVQNNG